MTAADLYAVPDQPPEDPGEGFTRQPPQDVAAEQCVLGGMLMSADAIADVVEILKTGDFYQPKHGLIFDTIVDLATRGEPVDIVTVTAALVDAGTVGRAGGAPYLHTLIAAVPTVANTGYYARIVADRAVLRRLVEAGTQLIQLGQGATASARSRGEVLALAEKLFAEAVETSTPSAALVRVGDLLDDATVAIEANSDPATRKTGVPTGLIDLDRLTGGFRPGQLVIVAGRPGMGKSIAGLGFARAAAKSGVPTAVFSLEMTRMELLYRMLAAESGVPHHRLTQGGMDDLDWMRLARRQADLADFPLWICDERAITPHEIHAMCKQLQRRQGLGLVIIDYLQLMSSPKRVESRQQEVSDFSRHLKLMAGDLGVPVIALCQLNRGPATRADRRPQSADLRESGSLEQNADIVILLHRPDYYDQECERAGEIDVIVDKSRDTAEDTIVAVAQLHLSRIADMAVPDGM